MSEKKDPDQKMANIAPFGLRMRAELKDRVQASALRNNRSMNAEIVRLLDFALDYFEQFEGSARLEHFSEEQLQREDEISKSIAANYPDVPNLRLSFEKIFRDLEGIKGEISRITKGADGEIEIEFPYPELDPIENKKGKD